MAGTDVFTYRSTDVGAPTLPIAASSLISVLDACLLNGYNTKTPSGIVRSGSVATVSFATAHGYANDGVTKILHEGWDQAEYNGVFVPFNVTTLTYDISVTGSPATPGTGSSPSSKVPPLGWTKVFSGTGKAAYRSSESLATKLLLRIDDNNPNADSGRTAFARGYETMSDVDAGAGLFPTTVQMASGIWINKAYTSDSGDRSWVLVGDGHEFHFFHTHYKNVYPDIYKQFHFGDPCSELSSDPYGCLIYGDNSLASSNPDTGSTTQSIQNNTGALSSQSGHYFARKYSQDGTSQAAGKLGNPDLGSNVIGGASAALAYPSVTNNALYIAPLYAHDNFCLRSQLKGVYQPLHARPLGHGTVRPANQSPINRRLLAVRTAYSGATGGETHLDIDGPWR